jgi:phosphoribosylformylglycinamidine cyclo-ligase
VSYSSSSTSSSGGEGRRLTYKDAGVDVDAGNELVRRIARMTPGIGGFSGLFALGNALTWHHFIFTKDTIF